MPLGCSGIVAKSALIKIALVDLLNPTGSSTTKQSTRIPRTQRAAYTARVPLKMNQERQSDTIVLKM
jgi:hypothetical protein